MITLKNSQLTEKFSNSCYAEGLGKSRIKKYAYTLKQLSLMINKDFDKATKKDIINLVSSIEQREWSDWTKHDYKVCIKKFYKWLRGKEDYPEEVKWIKTTIKKKNGKLPEGLLTEEEVKKLIDACTNSRDKALVSVLYESGCRAGELLSLKLKNVEFDKYGSVIMVDGKTGMRRIRLVNSTPYLIFIFLEFLPLAALFVCKNKSLWKGIGRPPHNIYDLLVCLSIQKFFATDATGETTSTASRWYNIRANKEIKKKDHITVHITTGTLLNTVTAINVRTLKLRSIAAIASIFAKRIVMLYKKE